jgi:hypothetical protein
LGQCVMQRYGEYLGHMHAGNDQQSDPHVEGNLQRNIDVVQRGHRRVDLHMFVRSDDYGHGDGQRAVFAVCDRFHRLLKPVASRAR